MNIYIYLFLILAMIFLSYESITLSIKYCPIKIKEILTISFILVVFRIVALLILLLLDDMKYVYLMKNLIFLNIIYIPIIIFTCLYIFYRNTDLDIKWFYGIFIVDIVIYLICIFKIPMEYYISLSYGYNVVLKNTIPYKILLCTNGLGFFMGIKSFRYKHSIKWGTLLVVIASLVFIGTTAMGLRSTENIGYLLLGDLGWMVALYGAIVSFKKKLAKHSK
ncbi:hypothetical protein [Clostridium sp.]|uniref:hypothetical protein n=1 Tax=Clostridium sp. TaxID=1506 RepID=UPI003216A485